MKRITFIIIFLFGFTNAQFFESQSENHQENIDYFDNSEANSSEHITSDRTDPTGPGDDPVPIDNWLFLLPLAGIAVGAYFLSRKQKVEI